MVGVILFLKETFYSRSMRTRLIALAIIFLSSTLVAPSADAAVRDGALCSKVGSITKVNSYQFRCVKTGKKVTWQRIVDQISSKQDVFYRLNNGVLERRAFTGTFHKSDSRSPKDFSPIRAKAFEEMNKLVKNPATPNIELNFDLRDGFPTEIREYNLKKIRESFAVWSTFIESPIKVKVLLATEKDLSYIRKQGDLFSDSIGAIDRLAQVDLTRENVWITGSAGYVQYNGELIGKIFLGTRSEAKTDRYNPEWMQVAAHEAFHVVQDFWMAGTRHDSQQAYQTRRPQHYTEGGANFVGYSLSSNNIGWYSDAMDVSLNRYWNFIRGWKPAKSNNDIVQLLIATEISDSEQAFELSYPLGALFYEWIVGTYGAEKFIEMGRQTKNNAKFDDTIKKVFGVSKNDLYAKAAPYILSVFKRNGLS
jgi:hypothetical protein